MATSSGKKVSNTTLGLRFMQNALRAKQQQQVEIEQAKVKDEAEWEIDPKVREGWKGQREKIPQTSITCETSYLPFLFPTLQGSGENTQNERETSPVRIVYGRRKFNKKGEEVPLEEPPKQLKEPEEPVAAESQTAKRPHSVSGFGGARHHHGNSEVKRHADSPTKVSVLKMLSGETSQTVGLDLRASRTPHAHSILPLDEKNLDVQKVEHEDSQVSVSSSSRSPISVTKSSQPTFMRPSGVDSPAAKPKATAEKRGRTVEGEGAVENFDSPGESGRRRKKKKKSGGSNLDTIKSSSEVQ